jgi:hypothetical protein
MASSWWGLRRVQQRGRLVRVHALLGKEWLRETRPRLGARDFLGARRRAIEDFFAPVRTLLRRPSTTSPLTARVLLRCSSLWP